MDTTGKQYVEVCGKEGRVLSLESLEDLLRKHESLNSFYPSSVLLEIDQFESTISEVLKSQKELTQQISLIEAEVNRMKTSEPPSKVISAKEVIKALYGSDPGFTWQLKISSPLPKVLYRYRPYHLVLELAPMFPLLQTHNTIAELFNIIPFSSMLPLTRIEGSIVTYDRVFMTETDTGYKVEFVNMKFLTTTKGCQFNNLCLVITHGSEKVRPVVLEGLRIRARKKPEKSVIS